MPAAMGPRFVLEAGFLVLLAVVVGLADLAPALIVLVMAIGWLLVSLIEYFAWRQAHMVAAAPLAAGPGGVVEEEMVAPAPTASVVDEPVPAEPPPEPELGPPPVVEEETVVQPGPEPEDAAAGEPLPAAPAAEDTEVERANQSELGFAAASQERRTAYRLEPLQPRPRRKWVVFGPYERPEAPAEGDHDEER